MALRHAWPKGHWAWPIQVTHQHGVRCGTMIWAGGQLIYVSAQSPVDPSGRVLTPGDIVAQTRQVMDQIGTALGSFGAGFDDVVKVNRWYAGGGTVADFEPAALACAAHFKEPGPAATG